MFDYDISQRNFNSLQNQAKTKFSQSFCCHSALIGVEIRVSKGGNMKFLVHSMFFVTISIAISLSSSVFQFTSATELFETDVDQVWKSYFTIDDSNLRIQKQNFQSPIELLWQNQRVVAATLSLTKWVQHQALLPLPSEKYDRKKHFGTWARTETDCQNTRAKILIQTSKKQVTFTNEQNCTVLEGEWNYSYTGNVYKKAKDLQIDHLVPLKHAYDVGAWGWDNQRRCLFANFLENQFHLQTVSGIENTKKGAQSPDKYVPPNESYVCSYLQEWLMVKTIWNLAITPPEAAGIEKLVRAHSCSIAQMQVSIDYVKKQRVEAAGQLDLCWDNYHP